VALGIATRAVPTGDVVAHAMEIARDIAVNVAPMSAALSKRLLWESLNNGYSAREVAWMETQLHHRVMGRDDAREGVAAFLGRRAPRWSASVSRDWDELPHPPAVT
jgi:enoyl-CoA hydratase/carnithine racemase